ncbi:LacI family DNA-binding transcriptional regulator [Nonomuraea muscovyensis]|uniref:LacI family transcriptional regulator n=1 Tax=Nonomuraea muscovyensis TaxID=1124761 RepID=A0A7X0C7T3_9ACTN|nr:substrate-binding domain-containing protein [Nonomuraea muscovyensis]MBB6348701.1 LacI family transcriptional regulator [Nonomuraea muscovyensis]MDF2711468.1 transcriptional regulatory DNA-binding repressor transcription regulator protein [Nonomuraea muscovyensis]
MGTVSIKDVAARAGVSPGTVSNVLNRPEKVAGDTRTRVEAAIKDLGFVRHGSASTLRAGHSRTIGLSVIDIGNPFFTDVAAGVEDVASERGYAVILGNSSGSRAKEERNLLVFAEQRVRGVLITPSDEDASRLDRLRERGISMVLVDHPAEQSGQCAVAVNDVTGGAMAVAHLLGGGAERLGYVTGPATIRQCQDRRRGAEQALATAGRDPGSLVEIAMPAMTARAGQQAAEKLLADGSLPDALFCANDLLALGMLRGLLHAGVRVPDDVSLIGYDDIDFASASTVSLSSVRQPTYKLGRVATELLLDECDNPDTHAHQQIMFQPDLVVRESTR